MKVGDEVRLVNPDERKKEYKNQVGAIIKPCSWSNQSDPCWHVRFEEINEHCFTHELVLLASAVVNKENIKVGDRVRCVATNIDKSAKRDRRGLTGIVVKIDTETNYPYGVLFDGESGPIWCQAVPLSNKKITKRKNAIVITVSRFEGLVTIERINGLMSIKEINKKYGVAVRKEYLSKQPYVGRGAWKFWSEDLKIRTLPYVMSETKFSSFVDYIKAAGERLHQIVLKHKKAQNENTASAPKPKQETIVI